MRSAKGKKALTKLWQQSEMYALECQVSDCVCVWVTCNEFIASANSASQQISHEFSFDFLFCFDLILFRSVFDELRRSDEMMKTNTFPRRWVQRKKRDSNRVKSATSVLINWRLKRAFVFTFFAASLFVLAFVWILLVFFANHPGWIRITKYAFGMFPNILRFAQSNLELVEPISVTPSTHDNNDKGGSILH